MSFKYIILNLLILFVVLMVAIENYETWIRPIELVLDLQETVKKPATKTEAPPAIGVNKGSPSIRSYILISEKNIFSPDRKDFPILSIDKSNPITRPQVTLYGVTIAGDYQAASVVNPGRPLRKGEREILTLKLGEKIGEYKVAKILPDRITMESNGDSFEVLLYDPNNPKKRMEVKIEVKPAMVTSPQPAPVPVPSPGEAPKPAPPQQSVEKPKEPIQQQVSSPAPSPGLSRPFFPSPSARRGRRPVYPPAGNSPQATE